MLKSEKIATIVISSNNDTLFTVFAAKGLGPIVSAKTLIEAKKKFSEAFKLYCATGNFIFYKETINSSDKEKEKTVGLMKKHTQKNNKSLKSDEYNFVYKTKHFA